MDRGACRAGSKVSLVCVAVALALSDGRASEKPAKCPGPGETLAIHKVASGVIGNLKERRATVVRTDAGWKALWKRLALPLNPAPPVPKVDFSKDMIVAVSAGAGGRVLEIEVERVERRKGCVLVSVKERKPPSGSPVPRFSSFHPFHIVRVPSVKTPVIFEYAAR